MHVTLISREHPGAPAGGGIGTYTAITARALARLGHDVIVLTEGRTGERREDGVRIVAVEDDGVPHAAAARLLRARRMAHTAADVRSDVVQAAEYEAEAWWIARRRTLPLVTRLATPSFLVEELNLGRPDPRSELRRRMERDQALRSDAVIAPSRAIVERVAPAWGLDAGEVQVIPNPIDGHAIRAAAAAQPPALLPERFVAFIGRLERRKGVDVLATALPRVLDADGDLHVVLVGRDAGAHGGAEAALLRARTAAYADRVHLLGELPRPHALAVVARAALVVLPSHWEAFGFVALEALALGRPVVASGGSGFGEIIAHDRSGWLVAPGDAGALAEAVMARISDPDALARVARGARERADDFEADRLAPRVAEVYERVLAARPAGGMFTTGIYAGGYRRWFRPEDRSGPFHALYERKRAAVLEALPRRPPLDVLDAGCGPGRLLEHLAERHRVTGCDISPEMLAEARRRSPSSVRLVRADARRLPFADGAFDALVALDLLAHLPDLPRALRELARVVRPGGTLVFDSSNARPWWVLAYPAYVDWRPRRLAATMRRGGVLPEWSAIVRHHRAAEVRRAIAAVGLRVERVQRFGPPWTAKWHLWHVTKPAT
jgi:glycogen synthase